VIGLGETEASELEMVHFGVGRRRRCGLGTDGLGFSCFCLFRDGDIAGRRLLLCNAYLRGGKAHTWRRVCGSGDEHEVV